MLAAATSAASAFFKTSAIAQNYVYTQPGTGISSLSSSGTSSPAPPASNHAPFTAGLWRVQEAVHKTNGKRVSVWTFDTRRNTALERLAPQARERVLDVLKAEVRARTCRDEILITILRLPL
jgi:SCY1-like protein 2